MYTIFVSYGHEASSLKFVQRLTSALNAHGFEAWYDTDITCGEKWDEKIVNQIERCSNSKNGIMILVMTPYSVRYPDGFCLNEIAYACDKKLRILPIMREEPPSKPILIIRHQWIDFRKIERKKDFDKRMQELILAIESNTVNYIDNKLFPNEIIPIDFTGDFHAYQYHFVGRKWFFPKFKKWLFEDKARPIFLILGLPGIGKSAIAAKILSKYPEIVAFHFFKSEHSEKRNVRKALYSIAYQISMQIPEYKKHLEGLTSYDLVSKNDYAILEDVICKPLLNCPQKTKTAVILLDALDEADNADDNTPLASLLARMIYNGSLPNWIRFVITSRKTTSIMSLSGITESFTIDPKSKDNQNDIKEYVEKNYPVYSQHAIDLSIPIRNSEGYFLCARYICEDTSVGNNSLPMGLNGYYYNFFVKNYPDLVVYQKEAKPFLEVIAAQIEPFSFDRLAKCLNVRTDQISTFLRNMKSFLWTDSQKLIHISHTSLFNWLTEDSIFDDSVIIHEYKIEVQRGRQVIADWLMTIFHDTNWNFFYQGKDKDLLITWFPQILKQGCSLDFDAIELICSYFNQVANKSILEDLVTDQTRFEFIKSIFSYVFSSPKVNKKTIEKAYEQSISNGLLNNMKLKRHVDGLKYLYESIKEKNVHKPLNDKDNEYVYFRDVQLPLLYVRTSYDSDYIFKSLAYGLVYAFHEEGRGPNMNSILQEIYKLATNSFPESGHLAIKYLKEVAPSLITDFEDMWANRAEQNAKRIFEKLKEKGYVSKIEG